MPKFWGYIKNEQYAVGCTGQTVYVYNAEGKELVKFKDIIYGYTPMFCPKRNIFIVKSTAGMIAVYSLDRLELIKKFRFSKVDGAQDDGFCFSGDGKYLYNIERHIDSLHTRISIYDTEKFELCNQLYSEAASPVFKHIEYDKNKNTYYVMGFTRKNDDIDSYYFIAEIKDNVLINERKLSEKKFDLLRGYKRLELSGFTSKAKEWSSLKYIGYDLSNIESIKGHLVDEV